MGPEGAPHAAPSRGIACVLAAPPPAQTGGIASSKDRGFPLQMGDKGSVDTAGVRNAVLDVIVQS